MGDVDVDDDDGECVTCIREFPEETTATDGVTTFSCTFESPFVPTRRIISGVEKRAGPKVSTMYAGDLRFSFFACFFIPKSRLKFK